MTLRPLSKCEDACPEQDSSSWHGQSLHHHSRTSTSKLRYPPKHLMGVCSRWHYSMAGVMIPRATLRSTLSSSCSLRATSKFPQSFLLNHSRASNFWSYARPRQLYGRIGQEDLCNNHAAWRVAAFRTSAVQRAGLENGDKQETKPSLGKEHGQVRFQFPFLFKPNLLCHITLFTREFFC
jgi:hypothetical protein